MGLPCQERPPARRHNPISSVELVATAAANVRRAPSPPSLHRDFPTTRPFLPVLPPQGAGGLTAQDCVRVFRFTIAGFVSFGLLDWVSGCRVNMFQPVAFERGMPVNETKDAHGDSSAGLKPSPVNTTPTISPFGSSSMTRTNALRTLSSRVHTSESAHDPDNSQGGHAARGLAVRCHDCPMCFLR